MELSKQTLTNLFEQLGLPSDQASINQFVSTHSPLPRDMLLSEALFWTPEQKLLLKEELQNDADWAHTVDELNAMLHNKG
ncbi:DUF2789 domain-containing protein [Pseudomonas abietaniphila]|uniref:DUF2789 domain-containing protein n=1 Tax=Pseudomonas abietaniphila TaxID=89065 RepID=A0A1G8PST3_9PSED|nr:DUF2789 domain-containing protein [Pseudomonas abietaniphila]SDI95609.1 Protein of unknown function [Pseudomonas abietaniphila]